MSTDKLPNFIQLCEHEQQKLELSPADSEKMQAWAKAWIEAFNQSGWQKVEMTPDIKARILRDIQVYIPRGERGESVELVECWGVFRINLRERTIRENHTERKNIEFNLNALVHVFGRCCVYDQLGHLCETMILSTHYDDFDEVSPPNLIEKFPSFKRRVDEKLTVSPKPIPITPFIVKLVEDWMRNVDCDDFIIREVFRTSVKPDHNPNDLFEFETITCIVEATVNNCGRVAIMIEFTKFKNSVRFVAIERGLGDNFVLVD
ncbi:TPA: hypothetical protein DF272_06690 [Candidatus Falkowbacteria bacterium]|nr:hypothetical protein [Candidatus Falkowbacteria bacterium]